eukprot:COSAG01_NODE_1635_length_9663_cov_75.743831_4_plen_95_part_00
MTMEWIECPSKLTIALIYCSFQSPVLIMQHGGGGGGWAGGGGGGERFSLGQRDLLLVARGLDPLHPVSFHDQNRRWNGYSRTVGKSQPLMRFLS